jgi:hypothetical protein
MSTPPPIVTIPGWGGGPSPLTTRNRERVTIRQNINDASPLQFDVVIQEQHGQKLQVTENPIETGVSIADHCFLEGASLSLIGSIADIKMPNAAGGYDNCTRGRSNFGYQRLCDLERGLAKNTLQPFEIVTSVQTYTNMVMTDISMTRDRNSAFLGRFTMSFREIIVVETVITTFPAREGPPRRSASPTVQQANQQGKTPTDQQEKAVRRSALGSLTGHFALPRGRQG